MRDEGPGSPGLILLAIGALSGAVAIVGVFCAFRLADWLLN